MFESTLFRLVFLKEESVLVLLWAHPVWPRSSEISDEVLRISVVPGVTPDYDAIKYFNENFLEWLAQHLASSVLSKPEYGGSTGQAIDTAIARAMTTTIAPLAN